MCAKAKQIINRKKNGEIKRLYAIPKFEKFRKENEFLHSEKEFKVLKEIIYKLAYNKFKYGMKKFVKHRNPKGSLKGKIYKYKYGSKIPFPEHSIIISIGNLLQKGIEKYVDRKAILLNKNIVITDSVGNEERMELDLFFEYDSIIYAFEFKTNIQLDTEKAPATVRRVKKTIKYLDEKYDEYRCGLISLSAPIELDITEDICGARISANRCLLFGYQEFFAIFGISFDSKEWDNLICEIYDIACEGYNDYMKGGEIEKYNANFK